MKPALFPTLAIVLLPGVASAQILSNVAGLFNIFVGLMLTAAFMCMGTGVVLWIARLGTWPTYRDYAIEWMMWGVAVLFVLVILLAIVQFVQNHPAAASFAVGLIVLALAAWFVFMVATEKPEKEDEH